MKKYRYYLFLFWYFLAEKKTEETKVNAKYYRNEPASGTVTSRRRI
jgi:hypothetical protein